MSHFSPNRIGFIALSSSVLILLFVLTVSSQSGLQVGYAVVTPDEGGRVPVATALFSFRNQGILVAEAGVEAVEPTRRGRIFVDLEGTTTGLALANPGDQAVTATLTLRDSEGREVDQKELLLGPGEHLPRFVNDEALFPGTPADFTGSLTFEMSGGQSGLAAVTLRQSQNVHGEPLLATLPVVDLTKTAPAAAASIVFPHIGAGRGGGLILSTQIILINPSEQRLSGQIRLTATSGAPLQGELDGVAGSEFDYELEPEGTYRATLSSPGGLVQGYAVVTLEQGAVPPAGTAVFQYRDSDNQLVSEAGVGAVLPTTRARLFVDTVGTQTGVAIASPGDDEAEVTFELLDRYGISMDSVSHEMGAEGHLARFADSLFPGLPPGFTGLLEIRSQVPIVPVSLKLTTNERGDLILTTLPIADLTRPPSAGLLVFPQIGFGLGFSTRLIFISTDTEEIVAGGIRFTQSDGTALVVPILGQPVSETAFAIEGGGALQMRPGNTATVAGIQIDPSAVSPGEVVVNRGNTLQIRPLVIDNAGDLRDDFGVSFNSLDSEIASVDRFGRITGHEAGFSTLTVTAGGGISTAAITVAEVTSGVAGFEITGIAQDLAGRLYLANSTDHIIMLARNVQDLPEVYAGVEKSAGFRNDTRLESLFNGPAFVALNQAEGTLFVTDAANHVIRQVQAGPQGQVQTLAGTGQAGSRDGSLSTASFNNPQGTALDDRGSLWIADTGNHTIRRVDLAQGAVETIAGKAGSQGSVDGIGDQARFNSPAGIAVEFESAAQQLEREFRGDPPPPVSVLVADAANGRIRRVGEDGSVVTVAVPAPAPISHARSAAEPGSSALTALPALGLLDGVHDYASGGLERHALSARRFRLFATTWHEKSGRVAGRAIRAPHTGASKTPPAEGAASFQSPAGVAVDAFGTVYVSEKDGAVLAILQDGVVVAAAQPGTFDRPRGIAVTQSGRVVVADAERTAQEIRFGGPVISSLDPPQVGNDGGDLVAVLGRNFAPDTMVIVAGTIVRPVIQDTRTMSFVAPPLPSGRGTVTVQNRGGLAQAPLLVDAVPLSQLPAGDITTVAGGSSFVGDGSEAVQAALCFPEGVTFDSSGNFYVSDTCNHRIRRVSSTTGIINSVAGNGFFGFSGDQDPANAASLYSPGGIAIDAAGNLLIADRVNGRIRKVDAQTGVITTIAGGGPVSFPPGDGLPATQAYLALPEAMAFDSLGNLYIADRANGRIRKVDAATGIITTVAGNGLFGFSGDGVAATETSLGLPDGIAVDRQGNLLIADTLNQRIRRVDAVTGVIMTIAGSGQPGFSGDGGPAPDASVNSPGAIIVDVAQNIIFVDRGNNRIRRIDGQTGLVTTVAGNGQLESSGDGGPAIEAALARPAAVAVDSTGNLLVADSGGGRIRMIDSTTGRIQTVAGSGASNFSGDAGPAIAAGLSSPFEICLSDAGSKLIVVETGNNRIRGLDLQSGIITTVAGTGFFGFSSDEGPATEIPLGLPYDAAADSLGNLFLAEHAAHRIRRVDGLTGLIWTVAGDGLAGFSGDDGPAGEAQLNNPAGIVADFQGNLFFSDSGNHRIRRIDAQSGIITTVAGNGCDPYLESCELGDSGPAVEASLSLPAGLHLDSGDRLWIADSGNHRVRLVDLSSGLITTVAGNGDANFGGDGLPATSAPIGDPIGVALDLAGNLFISDSLNHRVRRVDGQSGIITTVVGTGRRGFSGDNGPAPEASLAFPRGLAVDAEGNLFVADTSNHRIRAVRGPVP